MTARNARFWVYVNGGPVKLTLTPGQSLDWSSGHTTDEGWHHECETWGYDSEEGCVNSEVWSEDLDCDGRLDRHGEYSCAIGELLYAELYMHSYEEQSRQPPYARDEDTYRGVLWPNWQRTGASQRDYSAEAMGY